MKKQSAELYLGIATWLGVMLLTLSAWNSGETTSPPFNMKNFSYVLILFVLYAVGFIAFEIDFKHKIRNKIQAIGIVISILSMFTLLMFFQYTIVGILGIIIVVHIVELYGDKYALIIAVLFPFLGAMIDDLVKQIPYAYQGAMLYILFNFFALITKKRFISEQQAKNKSLQLIRELKATQMLLSSAIKRDERLRISQDLHDVIGHHLTALSLQLEVASHVKPEETKQYINQAKAISHLLLSDVRDTVSAIRPDKNLDLEEALITLTKDIPWLTVELHYLLSRTLSEPRQAEVIFRCVQEGITNTLKHANATKCVITLTSTEEYIILTIVDDGGTKKSIIKGNGLTGMAERVENLGGQLDINNDVEKFLITIKLPLRF
ncbi:sensor histidine kinase [Aliikangiella sp. IMCC44359]|uniref:sensor histidine kinase n=1 Tax=Aliikangiella sp. IMCC44359 TaxID=3459125 RepID=UPI00403A8296